MSTATETTAVGYHELPLADLYASPLNPRKRVTDLDDLAASIAEVGILEPLLVRPRAESGFEVIAGARRLEAGRKAGIVLAPCLVRDLDDAHALELAIVENNQRGDIHPLEEADAFRTWATLDRSKTPEAIAAKIGRPLAYVKARLKLLDLAKPAREAFAANEIELGHAQLLAKLSPTEQKKALDRCFDSVFNYEAGTQQRELTKVSRLKEYINEHVPLDVAGPETQEDFPELVQAVAQVTAQGATVLMLAERWAYNEKAKPGAPITHDQWTEAKKRDKAARFGVIVQGQRRGRTLWVSLKADEPKPDRTSSARTAHGAPKTAAEKATEKKRREAEQRRRAEMEAKRARRGRVEAAALERVLTGFSSSALLDAAPLRLIADSLVGGPSFDRDVLVAAAKLLKVPPAVFEFNGAKSRLKLSAETMARVVAVMALGACTDGNHSKTAALDAFDAFGVDLKAVDKSIVQEEVAAAAAAKKASTTTKAAKKR